MSDKRYFFLPAGILVLIFVAVFMLVVQPTENTDPKDGWVDDNGLSKICDGTTLVYYHGGAVPDSPECS